jgi:methionyl-tRNA synthetase
MSIEAMKQAREVIRIAQNNLAPSKSSAHSYGDGELWDSYDNAMNGLDQAIAEIKKQEVVAEMMKNPSNGNLYVQYTKPLHLIGAGAKFYTSPYVAAPLPTQRPTECKPLTDEQIEKIAKENDVWMLFRSLLIFDFVRAIEAAHGIKE